MLRCAPCAFPPPPPSCLPPPRRCRSPLLASRARRSPTSTSRSALTSALPHSKEETVREAKRHSPQILALTYEALAASSAVDSAAAANRPKFDLVLNGSKYLDLNQDTAATSNISLKLNLQVNIYDGGAGAARLGQAQHLANASRYSAQSKSRDVERDILQTWDSLMFSESKTALLRKQRVDATKSLAISLARFDEGFSSLEKILDLENQRTSVELSLLSENVAKRYSVFRILAATGGLIEAIYADGGIHNG